MDFSSNKTLKIHRKLKSEKIKKTRYARKPLKIATLRSHFQRLKKGLYKSKKMI